MRLASIQDQERKELDVEQFSFSTSTSSRNCRTHGSYDEEGHSGEEGECARVVDKVNESHLCCCLIKRRKVEGRRRSCLRRDASCQ